MEWNTRHPDGLPHVDATVRKMADLAAEGAHDYSVRQLATRILEAAGVPSKDEIGEVAALYTWVCQNITYRKDPHGLELVQSPRRTLEERAGDCDDIGTLLGALLGSVGYPVRFCTCGAHPEAQEHVWPEAFVYGDWLAVDPVLLPPGLMGNVGCPPGMGLGQRMPGFGRVYDDRGKYTGPLPSLQGHPSDPAQEWLWAAGDAAALTLPNYVQELTPPGDVLLNGPIPDSVARDIASKALTLHKTEHEAMAAYLGGQPNAHERTLWTQGSNWALSVPPQRGGMTRLYIPHVREVAAPRPGMIAHNDAGELLMYSGPHSQLAGVGGAWSKIKRGLKKVGNWINELVQLAGKYAGPILTMFPATAPYGAALIAAGQAAAAMETAIKDGDWRGALTELARGAEAVLGAYGVNPEIREMVAGARGALEDGELGDAREILRGLADEMDLPPEVRDWVNRAEAALAMGGHATFTDMGNTRGILTALDSGDDAGATRLAIEGAYSLAANPDLTDPAFGALRQAADLAGAGDYQAAADRMTWLANAVRASFEASLAGTWTPAQGAPPPADLVRAIDMIEAAFMNAAAPDETTTALVQAAASGRLFMPGGMLIKPELPEKHRPHPEVAARYPTDARQLYDQAADVYRVYLPDAAYFAWVAARNRRRTGSDEPPASQPSLLAMLQASGAQPAPAQQQQEQEQAPIVAVTQFRQTAPVIQTATQTAATTTRTAGTLRLSGLGRPTITFTLGAAPQPSPELIELANQVADDVWNRQYDYSRPLVTRFQQAVGLSADGIYGPATEVAVAYYSGGPAPGALFQGGGETFTPPAPAPAPAPAPEPQPVAQAETTQQAPILYFSRQITAADVTEEEVPPQEQGVIVEDPSQPIPGAVSEGQTPTGGPVIEGYEEVAQEPVNPGMPPVGAEPPVEPAEVPVQTAPSPAPSPSLYRPTRTTRAAGEGMQWWHWLVLFWLFSRRERK